MRQPEKFSLRRGPFLKAPPQMPKLKGRRKDDQLTGHEKTLVTPRHSAPRDSIPQVVEENSQDGTSQQVVTQKSQRLHGTSFDWTRSATVSLTCVKNTLPYHKVQVDSIREGDPTLLLAVDATDHLAEEELDSAALQKQIGAKVATDTMHTKSIEYFGGTSSKPGTHDRTATEGTSVEENEGCRSMDDQDKNSCVASVGTFEDASAADAVPSYGAYNDNNETPYIRSPPKSVEKREIPIHFNMQVQHDDMMEFSNEPYVENLSESDLDEYDFRWGMTAKDKRWAKVASPCQERLRPVPPLVSPRYLPMGTTQVGVSGPVYRSVYTRPRRFKMGNTYCHHYQLPTVASLLRAQRPEFLRKRPIKIMVEGSGRAVNIQGSVEFEVQLETDDSPTDTIKDPICQKSDALEWATMANEKLSFEPNARHTHSSCTDGGGVRYRKTADLLNISSHTLYTPVCSHHYPMAYGVMSTPTQLEAKLESAQNASFCLPALDGLPDGPPKTLRRDT